MTIFTVPAAHLDTTRNTAEDLATLGANGDVGSTIYFLEVNGKTRAISSYGRFSNAAVGDYCGVRVNNRRSGTGQVTGILDAATGTVEGALPTGKVNTYVAK